MTVDNPAPSPDSSAGKAVDKRTGLAPGTIIAIVGAVLAGVGTVLPWISASAGFLSVSRSGLEMGGDSLIMIGAAVVGALAAWLAPRRAGFALALIAGFVIVIAGYADYGELGKRVENIGSANAIASVGPGIYVSLLGGVLLAVGGVIGLRGR